MTDQPPVRQFYKTIIALTVLHENPLPQDDYSLGELAYASNNGGITLTEAWQPPQPLTGAEMVAELQSAGVEPEAWDLDEQGNDLPPDDEPATVDVIASGYEWTCPECDTLNREIEINETVTCGHCLHKFQVGDTHHAHG